MCELIIVGLLKYLHITEEISINDQIGSRSQLCFLVRAWTALRIMVRWHASPKRATCQRNQSYRKNVMWTQYGPITVYSKCSGKVCHLKSIRQNARGRVIHTNQAKAHTVNEDAQVPGSQAGLNVPSTLKGACDSDVQSLGDDEKPRSSWIPQPVGSNA